MTIFAAPGATVEAALQWTVTGLVGTLGVRIIDTPSGSTFLARTTAGIVENPAGSGLYEWSGAGPTTAGTWSVIWDDGATTPGHTAIEELVVTSTAAAVAAPAGTDLCTVADVKLAMEQSIPSTTLDTLIQTFIAAASALIENSYQRNFAPRAAQTYTFKVIGFSVDLAPHDLRTATTVTLDPNGTPIVLAATQYRLAPSGGESNLGTYTNVQLSRLQNLYSTSVTNYGYTELGILGDWGPAAVTDDVRRAAALTVASWMSARLNNQTSALLGDIAEDGRDLRPDRFGGFAIPFDAHIILRQYDRPAASFA